MRKFLQKLRTQHGETLVETLVAILILTVASLLFFTLISTSINITQSSNKQIQSIYTQELSAVENPQGAGTSATAFLTLNYELSSETINIAVQTFGETTKNALRCYRIGGGN